MRFLDTIKRIDWAQISPAVYTRYILMIVLVINTLNTHLGWFPILNLDEDSVYQTVSDLLTVGVLVVNTWKNNSVTPEAIEADKFLQEELRNEEES